MSLDFFARFQETIKRVPERIALQNIADSGREQFTFAQVAREVRGVSAYLLSAGVRPGDRVGIIMENHPRWGIAFLAIQSAGAVVVPLDVLHDPGTLAALTRHAECKLVITSEKLLPACLSMGGDMRFFVAGSPDWLHAVEQARSEALPLVPRTLDDELIVMYTSGTTGDPKGVILTQRNVYRNTAGVLAIIRAGDTDHLLCVLPLYHVLALVIFFVIPLWMGARVTYLGVLEAQRILQTFREEGITIFICVPQFFYLVHRRIFQEVAKQAAWKRMLFHRMLALSRFANDRFGWNLGRVLFRSIRAKFGERLWLLGVGGARFDRQVARDFRDLGFNLAQAYGMTETAALITVAPPEPAAVGSVGKPMPHCEIRLDAPDENGIGEVLVRGENIMRGYLKNPAATAETLRDGWLYTGDVGYLDQSGWLYLTGRKKETIVLSSGKNIYPEEIEHAYQSNCALIKEMCVLGVEDERGEEKLHAVVVPDYEQLQQRQIVNSYDWIRYEMENISQRLPPYKRVHSLEIRLEPLPRTTTRKIKRFEVQRSLGAPAAASEVPPVAPENEIEAALHELIREVKDVGPIARSMNLELDLGFSSLERVELLFKVQERFGITISDEEGSEIHSVAHLLAAIESKVDRPGAATGAGGWSQILNAPLSDDESRLLDSVCNPDPLARAIFWTVAGLLYVGGKLLFKVKAPNLHKLPGRYPFLLCPNHVSYLDAFLLAGVLPNRALRHIIILGYEDYFRGRVTGYIGRALRVVPVNPDRGLPLSLRLAAEALRRGMMLCVFPEGERSIDGTLKPFRKGPSILATTLKAPAVPVGISGTFEAWPRGGGRPKLRPVTIDFGDPVEPDGKSVDQFTDELFDGVQKLLASGQSRRGTSRPSPLAAS